jgi:hypothetical protein
MHPITGAIQSFAMNPAAQQLLPNINVVSIPSPSSEPRSETVTLLVNGKPIYDALE